MTRHDEIYWDNPKWEDVKETIFWIDTYECGPGEVAKALQLLTTWIDRHCLRPTRMAQDSKGERIK